MKDFTDIISMSLAAVITVPLVLFVLFILAALNGVSIHFAWGWFMVPLGLPPIGAAHAFGLSAFATSLLPTQFRKSLQEKSKNDDPFVENLYIFAAPLWILLMGYIAHLIMVS